jgi:hypothetical protein
MPVDPSSPVDHHYLIRPCLLWIITSLRITLVGMTLSRLQTTSFIHYETSGPPRLWNLKAINVECLYATSPPPPIAGLRWFLNPVMNGKGKVEEHNYHTHVLSSQS